MPHIGAPILPPKTVLSDIGDKVMLIGDDMLKLYHKVKDVWLLGPYLRWPFWWLWFYCDVIANKFYQADDVVRKLKQWLDGITDGNVFENLLYWLSSEFRSIRFAAGSWVRAKFQNISHETWQLLNTPVVWVLDRLEGYIPWFHGFRTDPIATVIGWLTKRHPWIAQFLLYTITFIRDKVYQGIGFLRELRDNPQSRVIDWLAAWYAWIRSFLIDPLGFIVEKVKAFRADVRLFFDNPIAWAREKIKQVTGLTDIDLSDIPFYVFRRVLDNAEGYVERRYATFRDVAVRIIMKFM